MTSFWALAVARDELSRTALFEGDAPVIGDGEVLLLDSRFAQAWRRFAATADGWVDVVRHRGPDALREAWLEVLAGRTEPRTGHVVTF